ncbi:MAG: DUF2336 domain-containing protein [Alphaproteobacteria bacterium]|nr:DUF2336 domain-containing protein [Alphaproteobacteria bacterium]MBU1514731.1 DUF2336 domain-containing protein [Alphaproteobacteria bacterium]MBU2093862.1 DUF2336 domain-containing protein [Alphaproteobacteria bacterium]MBU2151557.1 DUF2336 domain-containing protein [Alphaproteobacteria bacterium]MBU2309717.1 DUF2336 domain-containing protein [Alphaproteobacteria bacterium]
MGDPALSLAMSSESLLDLAKSRQPADRERLLLAIADLCDSPHAGQAMKGPPIQALLSSIFMSLVVEAERDIRHRLSEKLAAADWAPNALVNVLALDDIEIARPIISQSPVLKDLDLVRLLVEATIEHQIEVARRPELSRAVVSAILEQAEPAVLTALAGNHTAELSPHDMAELVEASRQVAALRTPLSQHPKLTGQLAKRLYLWVGLALRQGLAERFRLDVTVLDEALAASMNEAQNGISTEALPRTTREGEREMMEQRLIDKLHAAGQLRPGYLIRALREGRLGLFATSLAMLGRFDASHVQATIDSDRPELLALACAAVGIDRSVFPDILEMTRNLNEGRPGGGAEGARKASVAFAPVTPEVAGAAFRQAARSLSPV